MLHKKGCYGDHSFEGLIGMVPMKQVSKQTNNKNPPPPHK